MRVADLLNWHHETALILGTGHSLTRERIEGTDCDHIVAIGEAYRLCPDADVFYRNVSGYRNVSDYFALRPDLLALPGLKVFPDYPDRPALRPKKPPPAGTIGIEGLPFTGPDGSLVIHMCVAAGAARILLLGYDGRCDPQGRWNFWDAPGTYWPPREEAWEEEYAAARAAAEAAGCTIENRSPGSNIKAFALKP